MIIATVGKDHFTRDRVLEQFLKDSLGDRINDPLSKQVVFADDSNIPSIAGFIMEACDSVSMFSPDQTVVVHKAETIKADEAKALARWLNTKPDCKLLLEFDDLRKGTELEKAINVAGKRINCEEPKSYKMQEWISSEIPKFFKKPIDRNASQYLADALGTNTRIVAEEVEKVLLYNPDCAKITYDMVVSMVVPQREIPPYEICNSFGQKDAKNYAKILHRILSNGGDAISLSNALYNYAVDLLNIKTLLGKGMDPKEVCAKLGKNHYVYFVNGKAAECCRKWSTPLLCEVIKRLAEWNYQFKSSSWTIASQELLLASLVVH